MLCNVVGHKYCILHSDLVTPLDVTSVLTCTSLLRRIRKVEIICTSFVVMGRDSDSVENCRCHFAEKGVHAA